jgi:thioredoxin-related protein
MNPYNAHNVELVKKINYAWEISKDNFKHILLALMKRDIVEMVDKNCFGEACDVEESYELAGEYKIRNVPTILFLKKGEIMDKAVGSISRNTLVEKIETLISE